MDGLTGVIISSHTMRDYIVTHGVKQRASHICVALPIPCCAIYHDVGEPFCRNINIAKCPVSGSRLDHFRKLFLRYYQNVIGMAMSLISSLSFTTPLYLSIKMAEPSIHNPRQCQRPLTIATLFAPLDGS